MSALEVLLANANEEERWAFGLQMMCFGGVLDGRIVPAGTIVVGENDDRSRVVYRLEKFAMPGRDGDAYTQWAALHPDFPPQRLTNWVNGTANVFRAIGWVW